MALSHPYWSQHFSEVNAKRMATMLEALKVRLLPSFGDIDEEANAKVDVKPVGQEVIPR